MKMAKNQFVVLGMTSLLMMAVIPSIVMAEQTPIVGGYQLNWDDYQMLLKFKCWPTKPEMSDMDIAHKLNLDLPQCADVKAAVEKKDAKALEKALAGYMTSRIPHVQVTATGKPAVNAAEADIFLADSMKGVDGNTYKLGEHINWLASARNFQIPPGEAFGFASTLGYAYQTSGDIRYAERLLMLIRSFYHDARPPAQRPEGMVIPGPWRWLAASGRIFPNYLPYAYKSIGATSIMTDADRVMFLKMFWEHSDYCAQLLDRPEAHNFAVHVCTGLTYAGMTFPEFRDSSSWLKLAALRYYDNMKGGVLDDGGAWERSGYHFAYMMPYTDAYKRLRDAGVQMTPEFTQTLEKMYEFAMWSLAPTLEWPLYAHGGMGPWQNYQAALKVGVGLFPENQHLAYVASFGKEGKEPEKVARVHWHTGWLTMRSAWNPGALYMSLRWNGADAGIGVHRDMMSFNLFAYGKPIMTNPGSTCGYDHLEYDDWCHQTISHNTIQINWRSHGDIDNAGRLETWSSLPAKGEGFTYLSGISRAYEGEHAEHRRAILFLRPGKESVQGYWLMYDTVAFPEQPHKLDWFPYDIKWLGHFQPTQLTVDPVTKIVATADDGGNRLYLMPGNPQEIAAIEESEGPIITRETTGAKTPFNLNPYRGIGPYVILRQKAAQNFTVAFPVLLYPVKDNARQPALEPFIVEEAGKRVTNAVAVGYRVTGANNDDLIAMAQSSALRKYGEGEQSLLTDGETAYVRRAGGRVVEAGLVRGERLDVGGKPLVTTGPDISSVYVRYTGAGVDVTTHGTGMVTVAANGAEKVTLNSRQARASAAGGVYTVYAGSTEKLAMTKPVFSTDHADLCRAVGAVYGYRAKEEGKPETGYIGPENSLVVKWSTDVPADAMLEYRKKGEKMWLRTVNPEPMLEHRFVLSQIQPGAEYEVRTTSVTEDGKVGRAEARISASVTHKVR